MKLLHYRYFLLELIKVELTQNYKRSFLGVVWLLILPLMQSLVWIFLEKTGLLNPGLMTVNYVAFVLIGTMVWQLYNYSYDQLGNSISTSSRILMQGFVPMIFVIMARFSLVLVRFAFSLCVNLLILSFFVDIQFHVFYFLISLLPLILFCLSIGMVVSMVEVVNEDLFLLGKEFNKVLLFITPIIYSAKVQNAVLNLIIMANPLTYFISVPRGILLGEEITIMDGFYKFGLLTVVFFLLTLWLYVRRARFVVEKLVE